MVDPFSLFVIALIAALVNALVLYIIIRLAVTHAMRSVSNVRSESRTF